MFFSMAENTFYRKNILDFRRIIYEERPYEPSYVLTYGKSLINHQLHVFLNEETCF